MQKLIKGDPIQHQTKMQMWLLTLVVKRWLHFFSMETLGKLSQHLDTPLSTKR